MKIQMQGNQIDLTPAIKEYIEEKMKSLNKFITRYEGQGEVLVRFELARTTHHHNKGEVYKAEAIIHLPGQDILADREAEDARAAIDAVKDTLKTSLVDYKEKMLDQKRRA